jgi:hypothetical protein
MAAQDNVLSFEWWFRTSQCRQGRAGVATIIGKKFP